MESKVTVPTTPGSLRAFAARYRLRHKEIAQHYGCSPCAVGQFLNGENKMRPRTLARLRLAVFEAFERKYAVPAGQAAGSAPETTGGEP